VYYQRINDPPWMGKKAPDICFDAVAGNTLAAITIVFPG